MCDSHTRELAVGVGNWCGMAMPIKKTMCHLFRTDRIDGAIRRVPRGGLGRALGLRPLLLRHAPVVD